MAGTVDHTTLLKVQFSHSLVTDGYRGRTFELGSSLFQTPHTLKRLRQNVVNVRSLDAIKSNRYLHINAASGGTKFGTNILKVFQGEEDNVEEEKSPKGFFLALRPKVGLQLFRPRPDSNTVFVAGATGLTGARVVLELLHEGYKVRAGVDDLGEAQQLAKIAAQYEVISAEEAKRLNVVQFSADEEELTAKAIGSAGKLVVTLGDDGVTTQQVSLIVAAAALANVGNFVLVAPSGAAGREPMGFFSKLFSFFTGNGKDTVTLDDLIEQLAATEIAYTVIKSGGLAGVPDTFAAFSNVEIEPEGSVVAGQISRIQVASVVAAALLNIDVSENKVLDDSNRIPNVVHLIAVTAKGRMMHGAVLEVSASAEAPPLSLVQLLSAVPVDERRESIAVAKAEAEAEEAERQLQEAAEAEAQAAASEAFEAAAAAAALEEEAAELAGEEVRLRAAAERARERASAAAASVGGITQSLADMGDVSVPLSASSFSLPFGIKIGGNEEEEEEEEEEVEEEAQGNGFGGFTKKFKLPSLPVKASFGDEEVEQVAESPLSKIANRFQATAKESAETSVRAVRKPSLKVRAPPSPPKEGVSAGTRKALGVFKQETIYADDSAGDF